MKKNIFVVGAFAFGLTGCACLTNTRDAAAPDPHNPKVHIVAGGYLVVDQEPIRVPKNEADFRISWQLPSGGSYTFPADGIVIAEGRDEFKCGVEAGRLRYACNFRNSRPGRYKYTIKVMDGDKLLQPLDPIIINDN